MEFINRKPQIYILGGKSGNGKTYLSNMMTNYFNEQGKKTICLAYASYLKEYAKNVLNWDGLEETKPREFLQQIGSTLIKKELHGNNMLISRIIDDIKIYSYFFDVIIVTDARFAPEIDSIKDEFANAKSIYLYGRSGSLTEEQAKHDTETGLDSYNTYDYMIDNSGSSEDLYNKIMEVIK